MRKKKSFFVTFVGVISLVGVLTGCQTIKNSAADGTKSIAIPASFNLSTDRGSGLVIYGQRSSNCKYAPEWSKIDAHANAISQRPEHGVLSDGGVGERHSKSCGGRVPVRAIYYTPDKGYVGKDEITFWGNETVTVEIK